jgi:uncharacterized protein YndB with AHSA1/START domain
VTEREGLTIEARELVITRTFDAPRELVWKAWTERARALHWWKPKDFTTPVLEMDVRPGGRWRVVMRSPEGQEYTQRGEFREISPPERLVFTLAWGTDAPEDEHLVTVTFAERGRQTEMTFRKGPFTSSSQRRGEHDGWNEAFDHLGASVETT